ncbi:hypothetical protein NV379_18995 [Paenibacillus sp. N1-5-1-14]|uniref:hypothetical protein n=1 Tax=Paenibacillus radicibacter TaxID=2972488 RepID=UPI0021591255|nr:hypothetical protein [Paenibacillus radicibacter]MCR8644746.1 hypothetical protein [Paenibacillus radicibacter]
MNEKFNYNKQAYDQPPYPPNYHDFPPYPTTYPRKKKWASGMLSAFIPGTGHMYLGLMQRGVMFMFFLAFSIFLVVTLVSNADQGVGPSNSGMIVIASLLIPITYFYTIFDALQYTDRINHNLAIYGEVPSDFGKVTGSNSLAFIIIAAGCFFFMVSMKPTWLAALVQALGSYVGGIILIGIGVFMVVMNMRKR